MSANQQQHKRGKTAKGFDATEKVVVAVKASKEIPRTALVWALTHVVQPGDCIMLLVVVSPHSPGRKLWGFPRFAGDCASSHRKSHSGTALEQKSDISNSCSQMMLQLHDVYDSDKISVKIKIVAGSPCGVVAAESSRVQANWVVLDKNAPPGPPPLCSICQHKAPVFGKPPRWFSYSELELATGGFSQANFLAEGGFGSVHRGVLPDGQAIAVKQHKLASSQGDQEFCSEVEVLSCAQHRNVVMLIGFCVEDRRRLLVYEYICNGSLDTHLYGRNREPLEWSARQKIAVGAARGLRYLHEECRVGCIVHRDMRPNNILITHDFEPLVGDFGLARWQPDGDLGVETRVIGTFGYLAPEYAQSGQITEKADVYSFGVVLLELVTGRKAVDINRQKGQQCLTEWARPLLEEDAIVELIDPCLGNCYSEHEVSCMLHAASLCIRRDPHSRPRMSQVLRILDGDVVMDSGYISTPAYANGNRSGWMWPDRQQQQHSIPVKQASQVSTGSKSYEALRTAWERERESILRRC
ncbi:hypothetical protein C4D60_Mb09t05220 [Musa balbisiana]|uniref:Protein kinase domain-containing protein n=1 Tax=Musa balbisiana TaxID=52838 RepID=A0A4S8IE64_MUSBA|nr:hypothetical protein C4D60_Mb09t05220 [Musa balbisiana]